MLFDAFAVLLIAAVLSGVLAVSHLRGGTATPGWGGGVLYGVTGCAGLVALLVGFAGPPQVDVMGVGGFGRAATVLGRYLRDWRSCSPGCGVAACRGC